MKLKNSYWVLIFMLLFCWSCSETESSKSTVNKVTQDVADNTQSLFRLLPAEQTGLNFNNLNKSDHVFNVFTYEYAYNGGGVAVGDINNDGLPDVYFSGNLVPDKLFLNKGNMQFEDISLSAGIGSEGYSSGVSMVDINGDGLLDIYVCRTSKFPDEFRKNLLYINNGDLTFKEQGEAYNIGSIAFSSQAYFFDYDKDDDLDMYLVNHRYDLAQAQKLNLEQDPITKELRMIKDDIHPLVTDRLYRNDDGVRFTDVTQAAGLENHSFGLSAAIIDVNEDGWPDIYIANDFVDGDNLYINQKNGTFKDELEDHFGHISRNSMGSDVADINNDGSLDLFVLDMLPPDNYRMKMLKGPDPYDKFHLVAQGGGHHQAMKNTFQLNRGDGTFQEISALTGMSHTDWSWAPLIADFDNDGNKDIFITNGIRRDITDMDILTYEAQAIISAAGGMKNVDLVKLEDMYPSKPVSNYLFKNNGKLEFEDYTSAWGLNQPSFSNGASYADLDNDGDLDIIVNNINQNAFLYENKANEISNNSYLSIQLKGPAKNRNGIGAAIKIYSKDGSMQLGIQAPVRGYLSTVSTQLHFGLGNKEIARLEIIWPDEASQILENISANQLLVLDYNDAQAGNYVKTANKPIFKEVSRQYNINFTHQENDFVDYKRDPLLPGQLSREGPFIAVADVNGDQLADFYIGNAKGTAGALYIQTKNNQFQKRNSAVFQEDAGFEDAGVLFLDIDNDGDEDLYVASGGSSYNGDSDQYQDRLYVNDGSGSFSRQELPAINSSTSCVVALDIDNDNDLDLFVGGRHLPGAYPLSPQSYLLENKDGQYVDKTKGWLPNDGQLGMLTSAVATNIDKEDALALVIAGDWMPVKILKLENGRLLVDKEIPGSSGLWNTVVATDFDTDGDTDLLIGNQGLNSYYRADKTEPAVIYAKDFDANGKVDPIICHYINGVSYPKASRTELITQIPQLKNKLVRYSDYADATINDLFNQEDLKEATRLQCETFASSWFKNDGDGNFSQNKLPVFAQFAPVNGLLVHDFNKDGKPDFIASGNDLFPPVEEGRLDALSLQYFESDGNGGFNVNHFFADNIPLASDYRKLAGLELGNGKFLIFATINNGKLQVFEYMGETVN